MRKILSLLLTVCLIFSAFSVLTSCGHECKFNRQYSSNDTHHWRSCISPDCSEVTDKGEHEWDEGSIEKDPMQGFDGEKHFTCNTCDEIMIEYIPFTGMSLSEWNSAFSYDLFNNCEYTEISLVETTGMSVEATVVYKFDNNKGWISATMAGQTESQFMKTSDVGKTRTDLVNSIRSITNFYSYKYDAATQTYKSQSQIYIEALKANASDVTLTFSGNRLLKIHYTISYIQQEIQFNCSSTITLDYGNVELD